MHLLLVDKKEKGNVTLKNIFFQKAKKLNIDVMVLDYAEPIPKLNAHEKYLLYRIVAGNTPAPLQFERKLFNRYNCVSVSHDLPRRGMSEFLLYASYGLPVPKSIDLKSFDHDEVIDSVDNIGGFPIIARAPDKSCMGLGIIKINSMVSLMHLLYYFFYTKKVSFVTIQQYIKHDYHARLVVLDNKVLASTATYSNENEFRTNRKENQRKPTYREAKKYSKYIEEIAIKATQASRREFAGVDVILDEHNEPYLIETNTPCNFEQTTSVTGCDVATQILLHLKRKATEETKLKLKSRILKSKKPTLLLATKNNNKESVVNYFTRECQRINLDYKIISTEHDLLSLTNDSYYITYRLSAPRSLEKKLINEYSASALNRDAKNSQIKKLLLSNEFPIVPRTLLIANDVKYLKQQASLMGDFPIVLECCKGNKNFNLIAEDFHSLISQFDYVHSLKYQVHLRKNIQLHSHSTAIVFDNKFICGLNMVKSSDDQYSIQKSIGVIANPDRKTQKFLAIVATKCKLDFACIDYITDKKNNLFINDVKHNFDVGIFQNITGCNIAEKIISKLVKINAGKK